MKTKELKKNINDTNLPAFTKQCYLALLKVPKGKVTTYQAIAEHLGSKAYRAVGTAMKNNPYAPDLPCHRVINANGKIGNYAFGHKKKIQILKSEGILIENAKIKHLEDVLYNYS